MCRDQFFLAPLIRFASNSIKWLETRSRLLKTRSDLNQILSISRVHLFRFIFYPYKYMYNDLFYGELREDSYSNLDL